MDLKISEAEGSKKEIQVTLGAEEVDGYFSKAVKEISGKVQVPGFRKGKVPEHVLEMRLGKKLKTDVFETIAGDAYEKACGEHGLIPAGRPALESVEELPSRGKDFAFTMRVEVMPEVNLGEYKGLVLEREKVEITEEMVEEVFRREKEEKAGFIPAEGRPVEKGDRVTVEGERLSGTEVIDSIPEGQIPVGAGELPAEIDAGLTGSSVGDEKEIPVRQEDGREIVYRLRIKGIHEKRRIISNENFAEKAGYESSEQWKEDVRKRMRESVRGRVQRELREQASEKLLEVAEVEPPESLLSVQREYFRKVYEAIGSKTGEKADEQKIEELARRQVKENLVIEELARKEDISVDEEEIENRKSQIPPGREVDEAELSYRIKREKVIDLIVENAEVKDREKPVVLKPGDVNLVSGE